MCPKSLAIIMAIDATETCKYINYEIEDCHNCVEIGMIWKHGIKIKLFATTPPENKVKYTKTRN